ncbi:hypothetical protein SAMN04487885_102198 [Clostridium cadaveris]|uniref:ATLF-like domain-containing protein n=1 Tax=Clostridium cadaveris TaxID=1529 RepID=A0A1I2JNC8_9CLOT|nr:hypothetical protein [Clostridium cadaveris]MDM8313429.1 hypothetical protein [Clostridium cadaveris]NME65269.1 hypothetical protein [Clostridium cadaveris]UFH66055.1 hypothetical protein KQH81_05875 [Clostridium cadaveris]SFF55430.1 hypothetical protein SAMN04487885_102198 [Clostridium cadaveris]
MNKKILGIIISSVIVVSVGMTAIGDVKAKAAEENKQIEYSSPVKYKESEELLYEGYNPPKEEKKAETTENNTSPQEKATNNVKEAKNSDTNRTSNEKVSSNGTSSNKTSSSQENPSYSLKYVQVEGDVSSERSVQVDRLISVIPSNIVNRFRAIGGKIVVTSKDIATNYSIGNRPAGSISALYKYSPSNTIYVQGSSNSTSSIIHEFGHFVDEMAGFTKSNGKHSTTFGRSEADDFKKDIFPAERDAIASYLHSNYAKSSSTECFAEAFKIYIQNPGALKSVAPRTYEVVRQAVNSI